MLLFMSESTTPELPRLKIRFGTGWNTCNYHCEYCVTDQPLGEDSPDTPSLLTRIGANLSHPQRLVEKVGRLWTIGQQGDAADEGEQPWDSESYLRIIQRFAELPYRLDVRIGVGGETFINKTVVEGARRLSNHANTEAVNLISNLSFKYHQYQQIFTGFDLSKIAMVCSFHPTEIPDVEGWMDTAEQIKDDVDLAIVLVAWPPLVDSLVEHKRRLEERGLDVFVQAFHGWHEKKKYPEAYTDAEREILRSVFYSTYDYAYMVDLKRPGACYAGVDYIYVDIEGRVSRCGTYNTPMGSIFDELRLQDRPTACPGNQCWCDTENLNTVEFRRQFELVGLNQHKYQSREPKPH